MDYKTVLIQISDICGISVAFLGLRFALKWHLAKMIQKMSERNWISAVLASFSTNFIGIQFLLFCFLIDIIYLANAKVIITENHLIARCPIETWKILGISMVIHISLLFFFVTLTLISIIDTELQKKSNLIINIIVSQLLGTGPVKNFFGRIRETTNATLRQAFDCGGFLILLITLVLFFGRLE